MSNITSILVIIYLIANAIILGFGYKKIEKKTYYSLVMMLVILGISFYFQGRSPELPFLNIGLILTIYFNYVIILKLEHILNMKMMRTIYLKLSLILLVMY